MTMDVTLAQRFSRSPDVLVQSVGDEAVLLDLASEKYFGLNPVGRRIWELLDAHTTLADVHRLLCNEFDAPPDRIQADLLTLAAALVDAGLLVKLS